MTIQFPYQQTTIQSASQPQSAGANDILIIGQKTSGGTAVSGEINENITSLAQAYTLFGRNSHLGLQMKQIFTIRALLGRYAPKINAIALSDNGSGVKASLTRVFSGTATADGTITIVAGSATTNKYVINVANGDTASEVGDAVETAITANLDACITAINTAGSVEYEAINAGTVGNTIFLEISVDVAGISIDGSDGFLSSGATDPSLTTLFNPIITQQKKFRFVVYPSTYTLGDFKTFLQNHWDGTDGTNPTNTRFIGLVAGCDTVANLKSTFSLANTNCPCLVALGIELNNSYPKIREIPDVYACTYAIELAGLLTPDATVSSYTSSTRQGGYYWAGKPFANMVLKNIEPTISNRKSSQTDILDLTDNGITVAQNNSSDTALLSYEVVSTYRQDSLSNTDTTFKYLNRTLGTVICIEYIVNNVFAKYQHYALTTDEVIISPETTNTLEFATTLYGYYNVLSSTGYELLLVDKANDFLEDVKANITADLSTGKLTLSSVILYLQSQLRTVLYTNIVNING